jgi:hypothetical protein
MINADKAILRPWLSAPRRSQACLCGRLNDWIVACITAPGLDTLPNGDGRDH